MRGLRVGAASAVILELSRTQTDFWELLVQCLLKDPLRHVSTDKRLKLLLR